MKKTIFVLIIFIFLTPNVVYASENVLNQEDILKSQQESLNINSFIKEAEKYTKDVYEDIDMKELFSSAISGNIDNQTFFKSLVKSMGRRNYR